MSNEFQASPVQAPELPEPAVPSLPRADETAVLQIPRIARALRNRDFRLFWSGNFLSNIGTWMQNVAQGWLVLQLTNSPFWLGLVGFAATIPILFLALIGGVIADHVDRRKLLMSTQTAMMLFAFTLAALTYFHHINVYGIALLAMGTGIATALNTPSYQALVPQLVPRDDLTNAIALNSAQFNMSRVLGPTLGGFAMAVVGAAGNFFLNGLSFLAVILALTQIRYTRAAPPGEGHLWSKLKQGFSYVAGREQMASLVMLAGIGSLLAVPYITFIPYFDRDILHSDERGLGTLMACAGVGAFFGALTIAHLGKTALQRRFVMSSGMGLFIAIFGFSFSRSFFLSGLLLMLVGYCMICLVATINSSLQHLADDARRGRVMSIYSTAFFGLPPIGCLIAGALTHFFTLPHVIAGMEVVGMAAFLWVFATRKVSLQ